MIPTECDLRDTFLLDGFAFKESFISQKNWPLRKLRVKCGWVG